MMHLRIVKFSESKISEQFARKTWVCRVLRYKVKIIIIINICEFHLILICLLYDRVFEVFFLYLINKKTERKRETRFYKMNVLIFVIY